MLEVPPYLVGTMQTSPLRSAQQLHPVAKVDQLGGRIFLHVLLLLDGGQPVYARSLGGDVETSNDHFFA